MAIAWLPVADIPLNAQEPTTQSPAEPQPLPTPPTTGPLQTAPPVTFNAGPFGTLDITGVVSMLVLAQGNHLVGDKSLHADLSNGQVFIQKTKGWWQIYVQVGAYNLPALGTAYFATVDAVRDWYGPLPVGYLKLVPARGSQKSGKNFSILIGLLPTLIGAEYPFTFQNMNIERGLLWNQGNAINRGVQVNETLGHLSASMSWNDGFYSDRFNWLTGSLTYALNKSSALNKSNTLAFKAGGNLGKTAYHNLATPVQNNSSIYDVIYSYTQGSWIIEPYFQYTAVPTNPKIGVPKGAATRGGSVLLTYKLQHGFSLSGRAEYISSTGNAREQAVNLLYGQGSGASSLTLTPTFQNHGFFARGDFSVVWADRYAAGAAFGPQGTTRSQPRAAIEAGVMF
ncbi:MAG TPA: outer membrane beta-barrel protein [Bryobacteraceae bacterium]